MKLENFERAYVLFKQRENIKEIVINLEGSGGKIEFSFFDGEDHSNLFSDNPEVHVELKVAAIEILTKALRKIDAEAATL